MKSSFLLPSFFGISKAIDSSLIPTISNCEPDFILTEPYARLTSEGYPGAEYPIKNCTWLLKGPESSTIKILVEHAELESSIDPETNELMCIDFLEMEDQKDAANYQVVCDVKRDSPKNQYSTSNDIILSLTQDERLVDAGFSLIYEIVNDIEYSCDFNVGICRGWIISSSFPNKWTLQKGRPSTMTIGTGPNADVEGNGYYLISDASQPRIPGDSAVILSPKFPGGKKLCLSSFYHMFGTDMGTLYFVVEKIQQTSNTAETPPPFQIYTIEGNQGDTWKRIGYEIILDNDVDQEYVLQIMSRIGPGYLSDIAIDNIRIEFVDYMDPCPFPTSDAPNTNPTNFPLLVQTTDMITKLLEPTNFPMTTAFDITTKADDSEIIATTDISLIETAGAFTEPVPTGLEGITLPEGLLQTTEEIVTDIPGIVTTVPSIETQPPAMVETFQPIETQPIETQPVPPAGTAPSSDSTEEIPIATESSLSTTQNIAINTALPTQPTFTSAQAGSEIDAVQPTLSGTGFTTANGPLGSQAVPTQFIGEIKTPSVGQEIDETTIIQTTAATTGGDAVPASNSPTSSSILPPVPDQTTEEQQPYVISENINVACGETSNEIVFQTADYKAVSAEWNIATSDGCDIRIEFTQLKMSPRDSFNECTDVLFVYLANGNEDSRYCGSYAINPIIQLKGSTSRVKIEATEWQPRHIMAMRVTAEALSNQPSQIDPDSVRLSMQPDNVCISWPSEENADRYMITYQKSTQRNTKKTKFVTDSKYCFTDEDGLIENNDYTVELSPFAGPNGGPKSSFTFFLNYENTQADQGSDFTVVPTDSNLPDVQIEDPEELARLGREWTRSYFRWHTLTFSKWIRALNQYVPYLAKKIGADNLRDADAVCPMKVVPKQCQKISTVTDHNGCEFHYCDAENSLVEDEMTQEYIQEWETTYSMYTSYIYPQYERIFMKYAMEFATND